MPSQNEYKQSLQEAIEFLGGFKAFGWGAGGNSLFNSDGNLWNVISGTGAAGGFYTAFYWLSTAWFNKIQRYAGRYCFLSNGYAQTAVNNLAILVLGNGFEYSSEDPGKDKEIKAWVKENCWNQRSIEAFKRYLIDGEVFLRCFDDRVRFVDPDFVYGDNAGGRDTYQGVIYTEGDEEDITGYRVHKKPNQTDFADSETVPVSQMQHRANVHFGQKRGFSWILPVMSDLFAADMLTNNLMTSAEVRSKFAIIREHEANQDAVQAYRSGIQSQPQNAIWRQAVGQNGGPAFPPVENIENYPQGAIVDAPVTVKYNTLPDVDPGQFIEVLDATLCKISSHFHLPVGIFANLRGDRGSYASELVHSSWSVRSLEQLQNHWKEYDLALLEKCGFDTDDVQVVSPEIALVDKKAEKELAEFLIREKMVSKQTLAKTFEIDFCKEQEIIKSEIAKGLWNEQSTDRGDGSERSPGDGGERAVRPPAGQDFGDAFAKSEPPISG